MEDRQKKYEGDVKIQVPVSKKLENFWYHYKWHTIAVLVVIFIGVLLIAQMCSRTSFDSHILYAGYHEIKKTSSDGDTAPYAKILGELESIASDVDGDGERNVNFLNLFVINEEEASKLLADNRDFEVNETLVREDTSVFNHDIVYGDYYLCFLSERLYLEYEARYEGKLFSDLSKYTDGLECEFVSDAKTGIYLSSLKIYEKPAISRLPDDTVVVLRRISEFAGSVNKKSNQKKFAMGETMLKNILAYGAPASSENE